MPRYRITHCYLSYDRKPSRNIVVHRLPGGDIANGTNSNHSGPTNTSGRNRIGSTEACSTNSGAEQRSVQAKHEKNVKKRAVVSSAHSSPKRIKLDKSVETDPQQLFTLHAMLKMQERIKFLEQEVRRLNPIPMKAHLRKAFQKNNLSLREREQDQPQEAADNEILQNLGKADRTTDEVLNSYISNFNKQQAAAGRLSKEFKNYVSCARAMQAASKSLMDTLSEMYEQNWIGCDQLPVKAQVLEMAWDDFCHKLNDQVGIPVATYLSQFPEIRQKIAKRGRKLVDYDKCRHNLQALQQPNRKREEMKIGKAKEQLDEARKLYEVINNELHDELPALYDSRIPFLVTNLQTFFTSESQFHSENTKMYNQLIDVMETLSIENQKGKYKIRKTGSPLILKGDGDLRHYEEIEFKKGQARMGGHITSNGEINLSSTLNRTDKVGDISPSVNRTNTLNKDHMDAPKRADKEYEPIEVSDKMLSGSPEPLKTDELYDIPVGATTTDLPPGVLYRVRSTYKYSGEDVDELTFDVGDIIRVVEYDDPEEQEEGWLMGVKESTGEKGLFPANFTRPI